jgi:hypothetical protein
MANREKSFVTEWFLNRWLQESEKTRSENAPAPIPPDQAKSRNLPVRFMLGVNQKNVIVPIVHRRDAAGNEDGATPR